MGSEDSAAASFLAAAAPAAAAAPRPQAEEAERQDQEAAAPQGGEKEGPLLSEWPPQVNKYGGGIDWCTLPVVSFASRLRIELTG